jgi:hypothetical protein
VRWPASGSWPGEGQPAGRCLRHRRAAVYRPWRATGVRIRRGGYRCPRWALFLMLIITVPSPAVTARCTRRSRQPPCPKGLREAHPGRRGHAARPGAVPRGPGDGHLPGAVSADQDAVPSGRRRVAGGAGVAAAVHAVAAPGEGMGAAQHVQGSGRADARDDWHRVRQDRVVPDPRARPLPTAEGTGPARGEGRTAVPDERARHRPGRPHRRLPGAARADAGDGRALHRRQAGHGLPAGDDAA